MQILPPSTFNAYAPSGRSTFADIQRMIEASRPELATSSPTFGAAVVLLLGDRVCFNVARIARISGLETSFVAKAVRRLYDNGVWEGGEARVDWTEADIGASFWRDAAVAEGQLYRRTDATGEYEWGLPGSWWKAYDFGDTSARAVRYSDAADDVPVAAPVQLEDSIAEPSSFEPLPLTTSAGFLGTGWTPDADLGYQAADASGRELSRAGSGAGMLGGSELFPDAVWLG